MSELSQAQKLVKNLIGFFETKIELIKLDIKEEFAIVLSKMLFFMILILLMFSTVLFGSLTLANYFNELYNSAFIGYGILSIIYLVLVGVIFVMRNSKFMRNFVANQIKKYLQ